jgi:hypothetical protein
MGAIGMEASGTGETIEGTGAGGESGAEALPWIQ